MGSRNRFGKPDPIKKPSRVTDNMAEFVTKGKLTEAEKRRQGRYRGGRKVTPRDTYGHMRPVTKSTGGKDSARRKRIETVQKYNKRAFGGVNPKVTSAGERKKLERRGLGTQRSRYSGGRLVERGPGYQPLTSSRFRGRESAKATHGEPTQNLQGQKEFKVGKSPVTTGKGKRYRSGYMTNKVRGVDPPKGPSRVFEKGPHKRRGNPEGETRVTDRRNIGSTRKGSKTGPGRYSSGTANDTGARRTGGGKTPTKGAGQARSGGGKGGFNAKLSGKKLLKKVGGVKGLARGLKGAALTSVAAYLGDKYIAEPAGKYLGTKLGKAIKSRIKPGTIHPKKSQFMMGKNGEWVRRKVAGLPSGYKESEKKAFKQTKKWNKVNRKFDRKKR